MDDYNATRDAGLSDKDVDASEFDQTILFKDLSRNLEGIALNLIPGERGIYVADSGRDSEGGHLYYASLEGLPHRGDRSIDGNLTNLTSVIKAQGISLVNPHSVALDLVGRHLYWTDQGSRKNRSLPDGKVYRSGLDGSGAVLVLDRGLYDPTGLVLDLRNNSMVVADEAAGSGGAGALIKANMGYAVDVAGSNDPYYTNNTWWQIIAEEYRRRRPKSLRH